MTQNIISTGDTYRIHGSEVSLHNQLPAGTYRVAFSPMSGYSLTRLEDLSVGEEKTYGAHPHKLERIGRAYNASNRSLGVLMSGDKGMGKSMMIRLLAEFAQDELKLPTVLVDASTPNLPEFLDSLGEAVVVFDEFEKKFDTEDQASFLGLFDGISTQKRMYVVTVNNLDGVSDFLKNRPGRFHYHIKFQYPTLDEVREYITDKVPNISDANLDAVSMFAMQTKVNYDHLRAIAFELNLGGDFSDIIGDLNVGETTVGTYKATITLENGRVIETNERLRLYGNRARGTSSITTYLIDPETGKSTDEYFTLHFDASKLRLVGDELLIPEDAVQRSTLTDTTKTDAEGDYIEVEVKTVRRTLALMYTAPDRF